MIQAKRKPQASKKAVVTLADDPDLKAMADHTRRWEQAEDVVRDATQPLRAEVERLVNKGSLSAVESQRFNQLQREIARVPRNVLRRHGSVEEPESILNAFAVRTDRTLVELVILMDAVDVDVLERTPVVFRQLCDQAWTRALDLWEDDQSLPKLPNRSENDRWTWEFLREWCARVKRLDANAPYKPDRVGKALLEVLDSSDVLLTREEITSDLKKSVAGDPKTIRRRVDDLMERGLIVEPKGKGVGLGITEAGRRYLGSASTVHRQNP